MSHGWTYDKTQKIWLSPSKRYSTQRETSHRWSLWRLTDPGRLSSGKLLSEHIGTLEQCRWYLADREDV